MINKDSLFPARLRHASLTGILIAIALSGCASGGPYVLDDKEELIRSDYHARRGDTAEAVAALERAAEIAPDDAARLRALKRIPALGLASADKGLADRGLGALEKSALLGDRGSVAKLAAIQHERNLAPHNLEQLRPFYESLARKDSDKAALLLARLAVNGEAEGGEEAAIGWWSIAGDRGSGEAQRRLVVAEALRRKDGEALAWAQKAYRENGSDASLRIARGFLGGDKEFPKDQGLGLLWAEKAVAGGGDKASKFAGSLSRQLYFGADGYARDIPRAERFLSQFEKSDPAAADAIRLSIAMSLIKGEGVRRDVPAGLAMIDRSAAGGSAQGKRIAASLAMRLIDGKDGFPKDPSAGARYLVAGLRSGKLDNARAALAMRDTITDPEARKLIDAAARELADQGDGRAALITARSLAGQDQPVDAARYFTIALKAKEKVSSTEMRLLLSNATARGADTGPIEAVFADAATSGDTGAMLVLADLQMARATFDPKSAGIAQGWLKRAANAGNTEAQFKLGLALAQGSLGEPDPAEARLWLLKAKAGGNSMAAETMERLGLP